MEDIAEILLFVGRTAPGQLEGAALQGIVMFLIVFVASPSHIRNPYLRSKLAEVRLLFTLDASSSATLHACPMFTLNA